MAYPVRPIVRSKLLEGQSNGRLDGDILASTPGQAGGATVVLVKPAARAWRALCAAAKKAGHTLKATSIADSYRLYTIQERIFRERYTTTYLAGRPYKIWNGRRWYQRPGTAIAAVPGTSNHGWAQAVDTGEERDSDAGAESLDDPTLRWLLDHEQTFGWSHELQSEPWHLHYFAGDTIPRAVLDYEASLNPTDEEDLMQRIEWYKGATTTGANKGKVVEAAYRVVLARNAKKLTRVMAFHVPNPTALTRLKNLGNAEDTTRRTVAEYHPNMTFMDGPFRNAA